MILVQIHKDTVFFASDKFYPLPLGKYPSLFALVRLKKRKRTNCPQSLLRHRETESFLEPCHSKKGAGNFQGGGRQNLTLVEKSVS